MATEARVSKTRVEARLNILDIESLYCTLMLCLACLIVDYLIKLFSATYVFDRFVSLIRSSKVNCFLKAGMLSPMLSLSNLSGCS
jgi:NADH:ubiquinone oxidoreductase subunit B-like Fe-S oxidoreductase